MAKLPQLTANELIKIPKKFGFEVLRQKGSHIFLKHRDGRTTIAPNHAGEKLEAKV